MTPERLQEIKSGKLYDADLGYVIQECVEEIERLHDALQTLILEAERLDTGIEGEFGTREDGEPNPIIEHAKQALR